MTGYEIIKSYTLFLNTRQANTGTSNNCTFLFTTPIVLSNTSNRFLVSTPMIELPYSFSQVNTSNYNLPYSYTDTNGVGHTFNSTSMNIPIGNYNINALQTQMILSLLADILVNLPSSTLSASNFVFSYNAQTGFTTMSMTGLAYVVSITLKFSLSAVLGIMNGFPAVNQIFGTAVTLVSTNKVMVNPITSVYIRSDSLKFQNNYEAIVQSYQNSDVIAKVPITTLPNSIVYYRNDQKSMISNKFIPDLNIYVSDNLSTTYSLDMQGVNYGICIQFDEIQLKPTNAFKDTLGAPTLVVPTALLQQRDQLLNDLLGQRDKLEQEIAEQKRLNQEEAVSAQEKQAQIKSIPV
jgi:hypothetical protein